MIVNLQGVNSNSFQKTISQARSSNLDMCNFLCILHIHVYIYAHKYTYIIARSSNIQTPFTSKRKRNFQPEVTLSKRLRLRNRIADARNSQRAQIAIAIALPFRNGLY